MTEQGDGGAWFYTIGNERKGPVSLGDVEALVRAGVIQRDTLVWTRGRANWQAAVEVPEVAAFVSAVIPPVPPPVPPPPATGSPWAGAAPDAYDAVVATYRPEAFRDLYMWFWICVGPGVLFCLPYIAGIVLGCILLYRFWAVIQKGGGARTTPGLAVGLGFIPLFGFYWQFVAIYGLAQDMNAYCRRNGIDAKVNENLALALCIINCLLVIPFVQYAAFIASIILDILFAGECSRAAEAIVRARQQQPA